MQKALDYIKNLISGKIDNYPFKCNECLISVIGFSVLYLISLYNYLVFHVFAEFFCITVAGGIFMMVWNARRFIDNTYFITIAAGYAYVALIDMLHTLSYKGMGVFPGADANLSTQLWIAGRYMQVVTLLAAALLVRKSVNMRAVVLVYFAASAVLMLSIFYWQNFPISYVEGSGLTLFKKASEFLISALLVVSLYLLFRTRKFFDPGVFRLVSFSIVAAVFAELFFMVYFSAYDDFNLVGHFLKIVSYCFLYNAIIVTGLEKPYDSLFRNFKQSEEDRQRLENELLKERVERDVLAQTLFSNYANTTVTGQIYGKKNLRESAADIFNELVSEFSAIMDKRFNERVYKTDYNISSELVKMGGRLGFLKAGPRDVIDIYVTALRAREKNATPQKSAVYIEEGRMLTLELMGNLAAYYRNYAVAYKK
jgi:hypothetical protein